MITARSAQAKGRVERRGGVPRDRLVKELRLESDVASANAFLDAFLEKLDARLAQAPQESANHHRRLPDGEALEEIPCWEVTRGVARDWTVGYEGRRLQIEAQEGVAPAGARVTVRRRLDGAVAILYAGRSLRYSESKAGRRPNQSVTRPPLG